MFASFRSSALLVAFLAVCIWYLSRKESTKPPLAFSMSEINCDVVVVGSGLAGLAAAVEAQRKGAHVVIVDKESRLGGNSAKASSGINACSTRPQEELHIQDTPDSFAEDTLASGGGVADAELVIELARHSSDGLLFLESFGLDLSLLSQCGGHSFARTHRLHPIPIHLIPSGLKLQKERSS